MSPTSDPASSSRLADSLVRSLAAINGGAALLLLAGLVAAGLWQDAAMDFEPYMAVALGLHGTGLLAAVSVQALRYLRGQARTTFGARAWHLLAIAACAFSAACFAIGLAVLVWGALTALGADTGYDNESRSLPLGWSRT